MQKLLSRTERKTAARLMIKMARTHGVWTDGNRIYRGAELDDLLRKAVNKLVNDVENRRETPHRLANAMSGLRLIRNKPAVHRLPEAVPAMLAARAKSLLGGAISGQPGTLDHFLLARRLARKVGSISRTELLLPLERRALGQAIDRAAVVMTTDRIILDDDEICQAGVRLRRDIDGLLVSPEGGILSTSGEHLIGLMKPVRSKNSTPETVREPEYH